MQQEQPDDFVIATGETHILEEFVEKAFSCIGLDWNEHVVVDQALFRPSEIIISSANPPKTLDVLNWKARIP